MTRAHLFLGVLAITTVLIDAFEVDNGFSPEPREEDFKAVTRNVLECKSTWLKIKLSPGESATFQSPNYPNDYNSKDRCKWRFMNTDDAGITITCSDFRIQPESKNGKCKDKLRLDNKEFCGNSLTSYSGGRSLKALFRSNKKRNFSGFSCTATAESSSCVGATTSEPDVGTCKCGRANRWSRIVGGVETEVNEYPWQVAIVTYGTSQIRCGASVIGSKHLLTAAHCTFGYDHLEFQFLVGAHSLTNPASSELRLDAANIINHKGFSWVTMDDDIAIIELKDYISFTSSEIRPICLPNNDDNDYSNIIATVSGWGHLKSQGVGPDVLNEVDVPTMTNNQCANYYPRENITENMICAGYEEGGKDSCQNDSGGPFYYNPGSGYTQIGVVSWGLGCAVPGQPGVYARVTKFLSWISANTASSTTCPAA